MSNLTWQKLAEQQAKISSLNYKEKAMSLYISPVR